VYQGGEAEQEQPGSASACRVPTAGARYWDSETAGVGRRVEVQRKIGRSVLQELTKKQGASRFTASATHPRWPAVEAFEQPQEQEPTRVRTDRSAGRRQSWARLLCSFCSVVWSCAGLNGLA